MEVEDQDLEEITKDESILGVVVVLAAQCQAGVSLRLLKAGKHVLQEKPAASSTIEIETAPSSYKAISADSLGCLVSAVAENYRGEAASNKMEGRFEKRGTFDSSRIVTEASLGLQEKQEMISLCRSCRASGDQHQICKRSSSRSRRPQ